MRFSHVGENNLPRIVIHHEKRPYEIEIDGKKLYICMCGLTKTKPLCDDSCVLTGDEEESKLYLYTDDGRIEVEIKRIY
jgi:CDGSH-type Zn-finger protein